MAYNVIMLTFIEMIVKILPLKGKFIVSSVDLKISFRKVSTFID